MPKLSLIDSLSKLETTGYRVHYIWFWANVQSQVELRDSQFFVVFGPEGILILGTYHPVARSDRNHDRAIANQHLLALKIQGQELIHALSRVHPSFENVACKVRLILPYDDHELGSTPPDANSGLLFRSEVWNLREYIDQIFKTMRLPGFSDLSQISFSTFPEQIWQVGCQCIPILDYLLNFKSIDEHKAPLPSTIFEGGPGTGKTYQLIDRAEKLARSGRKILVVCYNRPLYGFLRREVGYFHGCVVLPFLSYCEVLAGMTSFRVPADIPDETYWNKILPKVALEYLNQINKPLFDDILVDEAQDLLFKNWWHVLQASLKPEGQWSIALDPCQGIYQHPNSDSSEECLPVGIPTKNLNTNYRNHKKITSELNRSGIWKLLSAYKNQVVKGGIIEYLQCSDASAWVKGLQAILKDLPVPQGNFFEPGIVVLGPKRFEKSIFSALGTFQFGAYTIANEKDIKDYNPMVIPYYTIHRFKGLEAEKTILVDFGDRESNPKVRQLFFLGLSRARNSVWVLDL